MISNIIDQDEKENLNQEDVGQGLQATSPMGNQTSNASISNPSTDSSDPRLLDKSDNGEAEQEQQLQKEEDEILNDFSKAKIYLNQLIGDWKSIDEITARNRLMRDVKIDVDQLRTSGDIEDDETFIPARIIDANIIREIPQFINYLKNGRRIGIFTDVQNPGADTSVLEDAFTRGMTYEKWETPHFKNVDGAIQHAWSCIEVVYDESKPLHAGVEYVAHEDLLFPSDAKDIQNCATILRKYNLTALQLRSWVIRFGFEREQVRIITERKANSKDRDMTYTIYKRFCKHQGVVYVSWFSIDSGVTDWLKKPVKHYIGIDHQEQQMITKQVPVPITHPITGVPLGVQNVETQVPTMTWVPDDLTMYPVFLLPYRETEKPLIFDYIGRVFLDRDKQEAQTAIQTAFVNALNRAQKVFASPKQDNINDGKPAKQLPIKLANGTILDKPFDWWSLPYPDPIVLRALQYMDVSNSQDIGQVNFAAMNREDSRKTAKEIGASEKQTALLDSVDLTLYSTHIRSIYTLCWKITQSQALQGLIVFLSIPNPQLQQQQQEAQSSSAFGNQDIGALTAPQPEPFVNDMATISKTYEVRAAGDVDVIQKSEQINSMMQDWPVISTTPLASTFLIDLLKLKYPNQGARYEQVLEQGDIQKRALQAVSGILMELLKADHGQELKELPPQQLAQLQQVQQLVQQAMASP